MNDPALNGTAAAANGRTESSWRLEYDTYVAEQEGRRESLCALGNGYFVTRGAAPETAADETHYPGTYVAGLYNRLESHVDGRVVEDESLVNLPNWLVLRFRVDGEDWFDLCSADLLDFHQQLDMRRAILSRELRFRDGKGRITTVTQRRFVHLVQPHLAGLETTITPENWSGILDVRSALDGTVQNTGVERYRPLAGDHLRHVAAAEVDDDTIELQVDTVQSGIRVAQVARTRIFDAASVARPAGQVFTQDRYVCQEFRLGVTQGQATRIEKIVALYTSRDRAISEPALQARTAIERAVDFDSLLAVNKRAWRHLWNRFHLALPKDRQAQRILDLHIFQLLQTVSSNTIELDVGVPARGLHGEGYKGHIFWDEIFIFPFLTLHMPELTRSLLGYRYRRLPEARWAARQAGYQGAMFPWQSGSDGREESQQLHLNPRSGRWLPDHSHLQRHIGSAVAYNAWRYFAATGDVEFLRFRGAPLVIEVARFWSSAAVQEPGSDRFEIRGVMGPDEYHDAYPDADRPGLDNNAYTNVMAAWVLCRALEIIDLLGGPDLDELWRALELTSDEVERWELLSRRMLVPFHDGLISQFQGYENLAELDWTAYRDRYGDIQRLDRILEAEGDSPNRYRVSKQADVLMLFYLLSGPELADLLGRLGYAFDPAMDIERNVRYYLERTVHGSTLSRLVSAWVLARLDRRQSWASFAAALESDVADIQGGTTPEGIHLGAMAGTVDLVQRCYGGVEVRDDTLVIDPSLPDDIRALSLAIHYRGQRMQLEIRPDGVSLRSHPRSAPPAQVAIGDEELVVLPGTAHRISARP